jgi:phosphopantothenoylcysteine decarboxylase/phosphopantothenate--cysteine ligase
MGQAVATAALRRGAEVILISGPTTLTPPAGAAYVPVQTAEDMREAALQHLERATIVIKAAAVADYRVRQPSATKIKSAKAEGLTPDPPQPRHPEGVTARAGRLWASRPRPTTCGLTRLPACANVDLLVANDPPQGHRLHAEDNQ